MHLNNVPSYQQESDLFQEFSGNFQLFGDQQNKNQLCSKISKSMIPQQKVDDVKMPKNFDDFIEQVLYKQQQGKNNLIDKLKRLPDNNNLQSSENQLSDKIHFQKTTLNKTQMNRIYTKNYRQKKKQQLQSLKEENRFLKQKIDDLTFRLREAELQINKLKHQDLNFTANFNTIKQECLKEVQSMLSMEGAPFKQVYDLQQKFKNLVAFSNKPRLDLLNYLMSELLQNLVSDQGMYFIQCIQNKTGIYRQSQNIQLKKLDIEILEILNPNSSQNYSNLNILKQIFQRGQNIIMTELTKVKTLWKRLYKDYIDIINQGLKLETLYRPLFQKRKSQNQDWILSSLKLRLHFQKNKYRKDIRQIRQSWFKEIQQGQSDKLNLQSNIQKKCKIEN